MTDTTQSMRVTTSASTRTILATMSELCSPCWHSTCSTCSTGGPSLNSVSTTPRLTPGTKLVSSASSFSFSVSCYFPDLRPTKRRDITPFWLKRSLRREPPLKKPKRRESRRKSSLPCKQPEHRHRKR